jgi:hypothetical protein
MRNYAFAPQGHDEEANIDVLMYVPETAESWCEGEDTGYVGVVRDTGRLIAYVPYNTFKLPTFSEEDLQALREAQADR